MSEDENTLKFVRNDAKAKVLFIANKLIDLLIIVINMALQSKHDAVVTYSIICGLLQTHLLIILFLIARRVNAIDISYDQQENIECFKNQITLLLSIVMNQDYSLLLWIATGLILLNLIITLEGIKIIDMLNFESTIQKIYFYMLAFIQLITGFLILSLIIYQVLKIVLQKMGFRNYRPHLCYKAHLRAQVINNKLHRRNTIKYTILFCEILILYNTLKIILISIFMDSEMIYIMIYILVLSIYTIFLFGKMILFLKDQIQILKPKALIKQSDINTNCFISWFVLLKSILITQNFKYWTIFFAILIVGQAIYGTTQLFDISLQIESFYKIKTYIQLDCLVQIYAICVFIYSQFLNNNENSQPKFITSSSIQSSVIPEINDQDRCLVCHDKLQLDTQFLKLDCNHQIHNQCQIRLAIKYQCPVCDGVHNKKFFIQFKNYLEIIRSDSERENQRNEDLRLGQIDHDIDYAIQQPQAQEQFQWRFFQNLQIQEQQSSVCLICSENFNQSNIMTLPCNPTHVFHTDCIIEWLESNYCCPICSEIIQR